MCSLRWSGVSSTKISKGSTRMERWPRGIFFRHVDGWVNTIFIHILHGKTRWKLYMAHTYIYIYTHTHQNHTTMVFLGRWKFELWSTSFVSMGCWLRVEDFILDLQPHLQAMPDEQRNSPTILGQFTASRDISENHIEFLEVHLPYHWMI